MCATCQIQWIDSQGNPTPDSAPSIGRVRTKTRTEEIAGRRVAFDASPWFHICAWHARRLSDPGMQIWEWEGEAPHF
jgi:hypothetical protein